MAVRFDAVRVLPGAVATALVVLVTLGTVAAVAVRSDAAPGIGPSDWAAVRFTLLQAVLSTVLSVCLAVPVARALARRRFPGRGLLITLLGAPFILPVIVAVLGLLAVFGRNGIVSDMLGWVGLGPINIYGLHGVVLAHVFLNMPLAVRLILQGWMTIPAERFRLAASLGFAPRDVARTLEWPMLRAVLPGAALVIFLICTTSFAVALALGGGPRGTTVELAIYQAFRFEFDLGKAALLSLIQFAICAGAAVLVYRVALPSGLGGGMDRTVQVWGVRSVGLRAVDLVAVVGAALFLLTPLAVLVADGAPALLSLPEPVLWASLRSLAVALAAAALTVFLALSMALLAQHSRRSVSGLVEGIGALSIAVSPLVVGTGLFIVLFPLTDPVALALPVTVLVNAVMSLPFAMRAIAPALAETEVVYGRLADSLGMTGGARLRLLILPRLARPIGFSAGLAAALSMGDLGVIALFADPDQATLPMQLYRLMAAYRLEDAAGAALLLLGLSLGLFWLFDRGGRMRAAA